MSLKVYTVSQALEKLKSYCAYQERSQFEVNKKLNSIGIYNDEADEVAYHLIQENFLQGV